MKPSQTRTSSLGKSSKKKSEVYIPAKCCLILSCAGNVLALIIDQSVSIQHLKNGVISSFNEKVEMINKLQKSEPEIEI